MVIVFHPGHIPGKSQPVPDDVVSFLDGDFSTCRRLSSDFASREERYYEVGTFSDMDEARAFIRRRGLRVLNEDY